MVNALLPFFALYSVPVQARAFSAPPTSSISQPRGDEQVSPSAANPAGLFTDKVLICTAQGFKWVSLSELNGADSPVQSHPQFQCALCYTAAQGLKFTLLPQTPVVVPQTLPLLALAVEPPPSRPLQPAYGAINSRAPPFFFL